MDSFSFLGTPCILLSGVCVSGNENENESFIIVTTNSIFLTLFHCPFLAFFSYFPLFDSIFSFQNLHCTTEKLFLAPKNEKFQCFCDMYFFFHCFVFYPLIFPFVDFISSFDIFGFSSYFWQPKMKNSNPTHQCRNIL
jgi:hypothetical protein